jgi:hypothetical protein
MPALIVVEPDGTRTVTEWPNDGTPGTRTVYAGDQVTTTEVDPLAPFNMEPDLAAQVAELRAAIEALIGGNSE